MNSSSSEQAAVEAKRLHKKAWKYPDDKVQIDRCWAEALEILQNQIDRGSRDPDILVSYPAMLTTVGRHKEAHEFLMANPVISQEYFSNLQVVLMNTGAAQMLSIATSRKCMNQFQAPRIKLKRILIGTVLDHYSSQYSSIGG